MTDEHVLYGYQGSGSAAVEAALALAGLPCRLIDAASWDSASALEALERVNPLLQIPAVVWPDGSGMSESAAILIELGLRHPESGLLPQQPAARSRALRGLVYLAANCYAAIGVIDYPDRWLPPTEATTTPTDDGSAEERSQREHERLRAGARLRLHGLWDDFADLFAAEPFLCGERLSALDLLAAVVSRWSGARAHLAQSRPEWAAVLGRIERHPSVAPVFRRHWPGP